MSNLKNVVPCCIKVFKQEPDRDGWYVEPTKNQMIDKLLEQHETIKKYEAIEQELGITLEVLFKALKEGIWIKEFPEEEPRFYKISIYGYRGRYFISTEHNEIMSVNFYKEKWGFTKEELENK